MLSANRTEKYKNNDFVMIADMPNVVNEKVIWKCVYPIVTITLY